MNTRIYSSQGGVKCRNKDGLINKKFGGAVKRKIIWLVLSCLMVLSLVLVSCGSAVEEAPAKPTEEEEVVALEEPQYGGTLMLSSATVNWVGGPISWDMVKWSWASQDFLSFVQEALLVGDFDKGPSGTNKYNFVNTDFMPDSVITGCVAETWEITGPTTFVFHIREGVTWQDKAPCWGREFTAEDVAYSMNRVIGYEEGKGRWPRHSFIESVTATDKYTVVVETTDPQGFWGYEFAWGPYFLMQPQEAVEEGIEDWKNVCGTGPFMIEDYTKDASITYKRNPDYWGTWTKDGKEYQLPFLDNITIPIIKDESTRVAAIRTGRTDIYQLMAMTYKDTLADSSPELIAQQNSRGGDAALHFRMDVEPTSDIRVRQALTMAVDRPALAAVVVDGDIGPLHPMMKADGPELYTPLEEYPPETRMLWDYDPTKAKQLLTEAGYPSGFKTSVIVSGTEPYTIDMLTLVKGYWAELGVELEIITLEDALFFARAFDRDYEMACIGKACRPQAFNDYSQDHPWNCSIITDEKFLGDWQEARTTVDPTERSKMLKDLMVYFQGLTSAIYMPSAYEMTYWWPWVQNYNGEINFGYHRNDYAAFIWIDQDKKAEMGY